ncbi:hypothetical protein BC941DRAFT_437411 [Chlamydoabsidia padenii]|nr:hypothetical protein BC941DRAFT_437411 [Chlamydoabsidia padenii]
MTIRLIHQALSDPHIVILKSKEVPNSDYGLQVTQPTTILSYQYSIGSRFDPYNASDDIRTPALADWVKNDGSDSTITSSDEDDDSTPIMNSIEIAHDIHFDPIDGYLLDQSLPSPTLTSCSSKGLEHAAAASPSDINKTTYDTSNNRSKECYRDTAESGMTKTNTPLISSDDMIHQIKSRQRQQNDSLSAAVGIRRKRMSWMHDLIGNLTMPKAASSTTKKVHTNESTPPISIESTFSTSSVSTSTKSKHQGFISYLSRKSPLKPMNMFNPHHKPLTNKRLVTAESTNQGQKLTPYLERSIYKMSHTKLTDPRRSLREQVIIANLMFWYLSTINTRHHQLKRVVQAKNQPPTTKSSHNQLNTFTMQAQFITPALIGSNHWHPHRHSKPDTLLTSSPLALDGKKRWIQT